MIAAAIIIAACFCLVVYLCANAPDGEEVPGIGFLNAEQLSRLQQHEHSRKVQANRFRGVPVGAEIDNTHDAATAAISEA